MKVADESYSEVLRLYANVNSVNYVDTVSERSKNDYLKDRIHRLIDEYRSEIVTRNDKIVDEQAKINRFNDTINTLKENIPFQTDKEKAETESAIAKYENNILASEAVIERCKDEINDFKEKISNAEDRLNTF